MNHALASMIGALIAVMIMLNGVLASHTGNYMSNIIIHLIGLVTVFAVLIVTKSKLCLKKEIPLYMYSAGAIGVLTVLFNNLTFTTLGVSLTLALGLLGQSIASILIDHFGLLDMKIVKFNKNKVLGLTAILLGILIMAIF